MKKIFLITVLLLMDAITWAQDKTHEKYHNTDHLSFISSQVPVNKNGELISSTIEEQIQQTFKNLVETAKEAGATIENGKIKNVVKLNVYLSDLGDLNKVDQQSLNYLTGSLPARTPLGGINYGTSGFLISIDAVVELPK